MFSNSNRAYLFLKEFVMKGFTVNVKLVRTAKSSLPLRLEAYGFVRLPKHGIGQIEPLTFSPYNNCYHRIFCILIMHVCN